VRHEEHVEALLGVVKVAPISVNPKVSVDIRPVPRH
jgi:hypothetical protein